MIYLGHIKYMNHVITEELEGIWLCREKCQCVSQGVLPMSGGVTTAHECLLCAALCLVHFVEDTQK